MMILLAIPSTYIKVMDQYPFPLKWTQHAHHSQLQGTSAMLEIATI